MRARGFYDAIVRVARVVQDGKKVRVTIEVEEGRPVIVEEPEIVGDEAVEARAARASTEDHRRRAPEGRCASTRTSSRRPRRPP